MSNEQTKTSHNLTFINKAFLFIRNIQIAISFLLVLRLLAGNRPSWSGWSCSGVVNNLIEAKVSHLSMRWWQSFWWNVRGCRALAIAKNQLREVIDHTGARSTWPRGSISCKQTKNKQETKICNQDIANIRGKLYWSRWGSVTSWSGRWTQTKYMKLQLWRTFSLKKPKV